MDRRCSRRVALLPLLSRPALCGRADALDGHGRGDDLDALKALQVEQVRITRDDQIGLRCKRCGQHLVIGRIARDGRRNDGRRDERHQRRIAVAGSRYPGSRYQVLPFASAAPL